MSLWDLKSAFSCKIKTCRPHLSAFSLLPVILQSHRYLPSFREAATRVCVCTCVCTCERVSVCVHTCPQAYLHLHLRSHPHHMHAFFRQEHAFISPVTTNVHGQTRRRGPLPCSPVMTKSGPAQSVRASVHAAPTPSCSSPREVRPHLGTQQV